jgi:lipid-binding SYLF domain-containing protein
MKLTLRRATRAVLLGTALLAGTFAAPHAQAASQQDQQDLVDRATLALNEVLGSVEAGQARDVLPNARAVMVCPRVFRAGFIFGGEGGGCVLLARGGQGTWSAPAFYEMGGASFGLQIGIQDAAVVMMIMRQGALRAVMDSQFRLGADASVALVTLGGGVEGATTAALNADILAFAKTRGLYGGLTLQGSVMNADSAADEAYYSQAVGTVDIVMAMRANNPGADPLRAALMKYGSSPQPMLAAAPAYSPPPSQPTYPAGAPAPVQSQSLAPPR